MKTNHFFPAFTLLMLLPITTWGQHEHNHDHEHEHQHENTVQSESNDRDHGVGHLSKTPEIEAALADGGKAVVADVLGVVCDFCAVAMNKIFGKRDEVAAVYVDLDTKALNLVFKPGQDLDDETIAALAVEAGYRIAAVYRDDALMME